MIESLEQEELLTYPIFVSDMNDVLNVAIYLPVFASEILEKEESVDEKRKWMTTDVNAVSKDECIMDSINKDDTKMESTDESLLKEDLFKSFDGYSDGDEHLYISSVGVSEPDYRGDEHPITPWLLKRIYEKR